MTKKVRTTKARTMPARIDGKDDDMDSDSEDNNNTWRGAGRGMMKYFLILRGD